MVLVLIRHAITVNNSPSEKTVKENPVYDFLHDYNDFPLLPEGELEAYLAGKRLADFDFDSILVSPLARTLMTAANIAKLQRRTKKIEILPDLQECGIENFSGLPDEALNRIYPYIEKSPIPTKTGWTHEISKEDDKASWERAERVKKHLTERFTDNDTVLIVSHGTFLEDYLIPVLSGLTYEMHKHLSFAMFNCGITRIRLKNNGDAFISAQNETDYLGNARAGDPLFYC